MLSQEQHIVLSAEDEAQLVDLELRAGESGVQQRSPSGVTVAAV